ncbi:MAG: CPBP family intramembrane glutamic endopeptidase [Saprospiraceae bacterium]
MRVADLAKPLAAFLVLFMLYHAAEYAFLFRQSIPGFLGGMGLFFAFVWWFIEKQDDGNRGGWGLASVPFGRHLVRGLALGLGYAGIAFLFSLKLGLVKVVGLPGAGELIGQLALLSFGVLLSSFSEDILTRCLIYRYGRQKIGYQALVFVSSFVYVLNHIYRLADGWLLLGHLFVLGILLAVPLMRTGSAGATLGIHWGMNIVYQLVSHVIKTEEGEGAVSPLFIQVALEAAMVPVVSYLFSKRAGQPV